MKNLKQQVIDVLSKDGGKIEQYIEQNLIALKYHICFKDDNLFVDFRNELYSEDTQFTFIYNIYRPLITVLKAIFNEIHYTSESDNQYDIVDSKKDDKYELEFWEKVTEVANDYNSHYFEIHSDSSFIGLVISCENNIIDTKDIKMNCQKMIEDIINIGFIFTAKLLIAYGYEIE